jgi:hypothetical protein
VHNSARRLGFAAQTHWYFAEAKGSLRDGRFLASVLCVFNGIEASVRWLHAAHFPKNEAYLEGVPIFGHGLLRDLESLGYKVEVLAFPGETDFLSKIKSKKPQVELLRHRNNLAHGNVTEFFQSSPESDERIFSPECLRDLANTLEEVSNAWLREVERYREAPDATPGSISEVQNLRRGA